MSRSVEARSMPVPEKSPSEEGRISPDIEAKEKIDAAVKKALETKLKDMGRMFEYFEAGFSPDHLIDAFREAKVTEKSNGIKDISEKHDIPLSMLEAFIKLSETNDINSTAGLFRRFDEVLARYRETYKETVNYFDKLEQLKEKWQNAAEEKQRASHEDLVSKLAEVKAKRETAKKAQEEAETEKFNKLVADINSGKFTAVEVLDLKPEQRQALLDHASKLAKEEKGTAGTDFYERLDAIGLTPKTARVSEVAANFRERASQRETLPQVGTGSVARETRSRIPHTRKEAPESKVGNVKGESLEVPQVQQESMWKNFWRSLTKNYGGPGQKAYDTAMFGTEPAGGKQSGFLRRFWDRLGEKKEISEEEAAAKIDRQAEKAAKQKYRPLVRELKKFGTSFSEASRFAGISEKETELAINILMGKVVTLDEQQERLLKNGLDKSLKFSSEQPKNKARELLYNLYDAAATEINLRDRPVRKSLKVRKAIGRAISDLDRGADAAGRAGQSR